MAMTLDDVNARNYTYVSLFQPDCKIGDAYHITFLVPSPFKAPAMEMALLYIAECQTTGKHGIIHAVPHPDHVTLFPRNYVAKARKLFEEGAYYVPK